MELPGSFLKAMQSLLEEEYPAFLESRSRPAVRGLRRNPLKCGEQLLRESLPFPIKPTPFSSLSFTFQAGEEGVGKLPAHHAGLFYVQEPSACSAVTVLDPQPGERVLDLCAAPGGKSTQIAGLLEGRGLLWSNELVKGRAQILLSNVERLGVRNAVVSSCHPQRLCESLLAPADTLGYCASILCNKCLYILLMHVIHMIHLSRLSHLTHLMRLMDLMRVNICICICACCNMCMLHITYDVSHGIRHI